MERNFSLQPTNWVVCDYKLGTRLLYMYKVIKKCAKREPKNKINEQPCTYVQINVIHKCRKMWKPYCEPFESLTITHHTKTTF